MFADFWDVKWNLRFGLIGISLVIYNSEYFFFLWLLTSCSSSENFIYSYPLTTYQLRANWSFLLVSISSIILDIKIFLLKRFKAIIFSRGEVLKLWPRGWKRKRNYVSELSPDHKGPFIHSGFDGDSWEELCQLCQEVGFLPQDCLSDHWDILKWFRVPSYVTGSPSTHSYPLAPNTQLVEIFFSLLIWLLA